MTDSITLCGSCSVSRDVRQCRRGRAGRETRSGFRPSDDEVDVLFVVQHDAFAHPVHVHPWVGVDVHLDVACGHAQVGCQFLLAEPHLLHGDYLSYVPCASHGLIPFFLRIVCHTARRRCRGKRSRPRILPCSMRRAGSGS